MFLKRGLFALLMVFGTLVGSIATISVAASPAPSVSQSDRESDEGTPASDDENESTGSGDVITVLDERGDEMLAITVENVDTDWQDYSQFSTPDRGYHFVALEITVENIGDAEQEVSTFDFILRDEFGFLNGTAFISIDEESNSADIGEFESGAIDSGDSVTGLIVFSIPDDVALVDVFYAPYGRLITVATLS